MLRLPQTVVILILGRSDYLPSSWGGEL